MRIDEAILIMENERPHCGEKLTFTEEERYEAYTWAIGALKALASADRNGHWIKHGEPPWYVIECSECGAKWQMSGSWDANNFCGNCGADMRGEQDE